MFRFALRNRFSSFALAASFLAFASTAFAQTAGVINACVQNASGQARIVASGEACKNNETAVRWNDPGAKGDAGPKGDKGDTGPQGDTGDTAATGTPGA